MHPCSSLNWFWYVDLGINSLYSQTPLASSASVAVFCSGSWPLQCAVLAFEGWQNAGVVFKAVLETRKGRWFFRELEVFNLRLFFGKVYFSGLRNLRSTWVHGLYVCFHSLQIAPGCSDQPSSSMAVSLINSPSTVSSQDFISCRMTSTSEMKVPLRHGLPRRKVLVKVPFFEWTTRS